MDIFLITGVISHVDVPVPSSLNLQMRWEVGGIEGQTLAEFAQMEAGKPADEIHVPPPIMPHPALKATESLLFSQTEATSQDILYNLMS